MRTRRPGSSRFCQLFVCCTILLIVPTLLFLSSSQTGLKLVRDPKTGQWYTVDSLKAGAGEDGDLTPVGGSDAKPALSQGNGAAPIPAGDAQKWRFPGALVHLDDVLKDSWGSVKDGANALGENVNAALHHESGPPGAIPPGAVELKPPIMAKLTNETLRAELGRSTWKFLHTMTLRFPDSPTQDERETLLTFLLAFSRLYPCAECAAHFQDLLRELPPQTSSRMAASLWLCTVHNRVNARLGKKEFDCSKLDETYDCGCGDGPKDGGGTTSTGMGKDTSPVPKPKLPEVFEGLGAGTGPDSS
ncbi:unnamed protein product [Tilletia controversa]|uniref:Sulfhydryl oxidase n=3 Tax=Tilletia TaxID=13289 RepID=A0A8X7MQH4_9BASI|nr:hypothetical protein CF336_g5472 [Tilletia laevis]KAE8193565.1 hypothetical protein CF328_g5013 [Tilletia controversa]KAE8257187.1 hypothetical protein A4X03_0g4752 [Tilletia caries]KAE8196964.1 hypothetical protein CF335_g4725 [Tilletia laevis]KAE8244913.1 hypothetical protein A4X06_0g5908 [Tilletia controversa]